MNSFECSLEQVELGFAKAAKQALFAGRTNLVQLGKQGLGRRGQIDCAGAPVIEAFLPLKQAIRAKPVYQPPG